MSDIEDKLREQMTFFDYIYPLISRRLGDIESKCENIWRHQLRMMEESKYEKLMIEQYKGKIQRIEQFLLEHGLIRLLGKNVNE